MRCRSLSLALILAAAVLGGCLSPDALDEGGPAAPRDLRITLVDAESSEAIPFAQVVALAGATPVLVASGVAGEVALHLGASVDGLVAYAPGYAPQLLAPPGEAKREVFLSPVATAADAPTDPVLAFRQPLDLGTQEYLVAVGTACLEPPPNHDCGLGEPSVEVDSRGVIYVSGVCCIGAAPPVLVSRDDGLTFTHLETPLGLREAFGIEGDFAIDADGTIYFVDIELAATFQVTAWDKDGEYLRHLKWPAPPLVDRPWVRAEGSGVLYYVYNTGTNTNVYTSENGGMTWSPIPRVILPYGLGNAVKGPGTGELWVVGGDDGGKRRVDYTTDGGATWATERSSAPAGGNFPVGQFDEAGNLFLVSNADETITVARRDAGGDWHDAVAVTPGWGTHRYPWLAAGAAGGVAVAWYGTLDETVTGNSEWFLFVAVSLDADAETPHWAIMKADPEPVFIGDLGRELLDFLQIEIGPDNAIHVAYSKVPASGGHEQLHYLQSLRLLPISPAVYPWGPQGDADGLSAGSVALSLDLDAVLRPRL